MVEIKDDGTATSQSISENNCNLQGRVERIKNNKQTPSINLPSNLVPIAPSIASSSGASSLESNSSLNTDSDDVASCDGSTASQDSGVDNELTSDVTDAPRTTVATNTDMEISDLEPYAFSSDYKVAAMSESLDLILYLAIHRFFTFPIFWPICISKENLANSGFFLTIDINAVQCYFCKLVISENYNWEGIESINDTHRELSPDCPLMRGDDTRNIPINDPTNYRYEAHRLYSLLSTAWNYAVTPYDLAKFGFYWTGSSDNCRCAFCRLEVRGWEDGDRAESEHTRWNPNCVFMNGRSVGNVPIGREISDEAVVNDEAGIYNSAVSSPFSINPFAKSELSSYGQIRYSNVSGPRPPVETLGVTPLNPAKHPEYATLQSRINSYKMWPMCLPQRPTELAEAGFYYIGTGDRVICFQCGGGLKDWAATDTPWCEHAKWFSRCPYLLLKKGKTFVDETLKDQKIEMPVLAFQEALANSMKSVSQSDEAGVKPEEEKLEATNMSEEGSSRSLKCKLCQEKDIETVYLPCGHMVSCMSCIDKETVCRTCSKTRVAYVRTFLQ